MRRLRGFGKMKWGKARGAREIRVETTGGFGRGRAGHRETWRGSVGVWRRLKIPLFDRVPSGMGGASVHERTRSPSLGRGGWSRITGGPRKIE